jgi:uncharacterized protein YacL
MSDRLYVFDSNAYINMQRHCPQDIFVSLWQTVEEMITAGQIISPIEVLEELKGGNDSLINWAKIRGSIFIPSVEEVQLVVRDILSKYPNLVIGSKNTNNADPFLVALAKIRNGIVVTDENAGTELKPKIPFVCNAYNIPCLSFHDLLRRLKITF